MTVTFVVLKTGLIHLVLVGLMAGTLAADRLSDKKAAVPAA